MQTMQTPPSTIYLIGFMGSGKSTVGRALADALGYDFIDTDTFVETRFHQRIVDMFASGGEATFRRRERLALEELAGMERTVLATGGGLPCYEDSIELLLETGLVIYFRSSPEALAKRLELCKRTRPSIRDKSGEELLAFIRETLALREPIYSRAQIIRDIDHITTREGEITFAHELADELRAL